MDQKQENKDKGARAWWVNCAAAHDGSYREDKELAAIDAMEDCIGRVDEQGTAIRRLITRFEACYHEADKEAERIAEAIGAGRCPVESNERPPGRKRELENCHRILSRWCEDPDARGIDLDVGGVAADELAGFIGRPSDLKIWQVRRIVERVGEALDSARSYHTMELDVEGYGEPAAQPAGEHYKDDAEFLKQTRGTIIHYREDGREAEISLAMAVDLLMPCHWDFAGQLGIILRAVGGDLHPGAALAYCAVNVRLSPLCPRLRIISNTLRSFWKGGLGQDTDAGILALLGAQNPVKRWLAASLDKTIRLQLDS